MSDTVWRVTRPAADVLVVAGDADQAKAIADAEFYGNEADYGEDTYEAVDTGEEDDGGPDIAHG